MFAKRLAREARARGVSRLTSARAPSSSSTSSCSTSSSSRGAIPSTTASPASSSGRASSSHHPLAASRLFHAAPSRPSRSPAPIAGAGALAAARLGLAGAASLAASSAKLRAANRVIGATTTPSFRAWVKRAVLGRDARGFAARVAGVGVGVAAGARAVTEPVPFSGRKRVLFFDAAREEELTRAILAATFASDASYLRADDRRVVRAAAVLWKLVNRLDPGTVFGGDGAAAAAAAAPSLADASSSLGSGGRRGRGAARGVMACS